jgi:hypothetical protein
MIPAKILSLFGLKVFVEMHVLPLLRMLGPKLMGTTKPRYQMDNVVFTIYANKLKQSDGHVMSMTC